MFSRLRRKPLRLELGERVVRFDSVGDFEFSLSSRTDVPATKVGELVRLEPAALEGEAASIRDVQRRFVEVLSRSLESPGSLGYLLSEMDGKLFSHDHDWRSIMSALIRQGRDFEEFKKIALVKYLQYLGSRQDVLQSIYANKFAGPTTVEQEHGSGPSALRETLIFDVHAPPKERASPRYARLPRGETVTARLDAQGSLGLILSRHEMTVVDGEHPHLRDKDGRQYLLDSGRNVVGRQPDCDVVVDGGYRDVSRQHLVVDLRGGGAIALTDLSSHGTFVRSDALEGGYGV